MSRRGDVWALADGELATRLRDLSEQEWTVNFLSDFQKAFAANVVEVYVKWGGLTWKQRKTARFMVLELLGRQSRRAETLTVSKAPGEEP